MVDPKVDRVVFPCILLSESEGTLLASALSCPDVAALKELGVAYSSVSRTVFKSACSLPFLILRRSDSPVLTAIQCTAHRTVYASTLP